MSGRLPSLAPDDLNEAQRELYDRLLASYGPWTDKSGFEVVAPDRSLLGPLNPLLFSPALGAAQIDVFHADKRNTSLSPRVHEVVILTVGAAWDSGYELYAHSAVGRLVGLSDDVVDALVAGRPPDFLNEQEAALTSSRSNSWARTASRHTPTHGLSTPSDTRGWSTWCCSSACTWRPAH